MAKFNVNKITIDVTPHNVVDSERFLAEFNAWAVTVEDWTAEDLDDIDGYSLLCFLKDTYGVDTKVKFHK